MLPWHHCVFKDLQGWPGKGIIAISNMQPLQADQAELTSSLQESLDAALWVPKQWTADLPFIVRNSSQHLPSVAVHVNSEGLCDNILEYLNQCARVTRHILVPSRTISIMWVLAETLTGKTCWKALRLLECRWGSILPPATVPNTTNTSWFVDEAGGTRKKERGAQS